MDERSMQPRPESRIGMAPDGAGPLPTSPGLPPTGDGRLAGTPLDDPRALTILTTEHWSLLSQRSLVYNEAFQRAGMFLTFFSATLVALGLVANGLGFRREVLVVAAGILALDLFMGLATLGRVLAVSIEDLHCLQGMNRLRHGYHETVPGLERYFVTGRHDDMPGVFSAYTTSPPGTRAGVLHGFTTMGGMLVVICATIGAVLAGVLVLMVADDPGPAALATVVALSVGVALGTRGINRRFGAVAASLRVEFPTPLS